jgi:hypothetical protein
MNQASGEFETPCCGYRDHSGEFCCCPDHERSDLHPFGYDPMQAEHSGSRGGSDGE